MAGVICSMCGTLAAEDAWCGCPTTTRREREQWIDANAIVAWMNTTVVVGCESDDAGRELGGSD